MKTFFLKKLDQIIGRILVCLLPRPPRDDSGKPFYNFLFIRPGGIGDAVLLIPALQAASTTFSANRIDILAETRNSGVFALTDTIDNVYNYDRPGEFIACLRKKYDIIIDTEQWHRLSGVITRIICSRNRIGFATNSRKKLFSHTEPYSHHDYEAFSFLRLLSCLNIPVPDQINVPFLQLPDVAISKAEVMLAPLNTHKFIAIFPGASIPERRWGADKFSLLSYKINQLNIPVVIVGGREDRAIGEKILRNCNGLNLAGKTNLAGTAAVLDRALLLVSGDSGILHVAVGLDIPTVSLFGPGISEKWAPSKKHNVINKHLPCSPCTLFGYTSPCPRNAECIQNITPLEVMDVVSSIIHN